MRLEDLAAYRMELGDSLKKFEAKAEDDELGHMLVVETKETYIYLDEEDADKKIDEARQDAGFLGATKKFKQGKVNKAGEITRPDQYTVVIKLGH